MKGRKPDGASVTPLHRDEETADRMAARGADLAAEMKPDWLEDNLQPIWDRLAPVAADPTVGRLRPIFVPAFVELCRTVRQHEDYCALIEDEGEFYVSNTRNGEQWKARPEVAQRNEAFRRMLTLLRDFGMTPAAERSVARGPQAGLFDDDDLD